MSGQNAAACAQTPKVFSFLIACSLVATPELNLPRSLIFKHPDFPVSLVLVFAGLAGQRPGAVGVFLAASEAVVLGDSMQTGDVV